MKNSIIRLENISKNFETQHVLNDVSIDISRNDFVVIMGESGAGKSTLINIMSFLEEATEGKYYLNGEDVTNVNTKKGSKFRRNEINNIFQKYNLFEELTVYENLKVFLELSEKSLTGIRENIKDVLKEVNLEEHINKKVSVMSQGEKQRVAIARGILLEKPLLFADEPTASVDKENRDLIIKNLVGLNKKGTTVVVVTHDSEYLKYANKKYKLTYGKLEEITEENEV